MTGAARGGSISKRIVACVWIATLGTSLTSGAPPLARAEDARDGSDVGASMAPETGDPSRSDAGGAEATQTEDAGAEWWSRARGELFAGIDLSKQQEEQVEAILARAAEDRAQFRRHVAGFRDAVRQGDRERARLLQEKLRGSRQNLQPARRIDEMRGVLGPDQRQTFDQNRRLRTDRLLAEGRKRMQRQRRGGTEPSPAAEASGKEAAER